VHKFKEPLDSEKLHLHAEPAEVAAPEDNQLRKLIDGLATFVARSGQKLENLYMEKRSSNPMFEFLFEGTGHAYYKRRLWEEHKKTGKEDSLKDNKRLSLDSAQRGQILGETPLRRLNLLASEDHTRLQSALASSFTKSASEVCMKDRISIPLLCHVSPVLLPINACLMTFPPAIKSYDLCVCSFLQNEDLSDTLQPFASDPAKQARYEQFLKDKYEGGLRSVQAAGRHAWTESERALETIEFETACQISLKRKNVPAIGDSSSAIVSKNLQSIMNDRFVPQTFQKVIK
jgi:G patch domain-containing protein 1